MRLVFTGNGTRELSAAFLGVNEPTDVAHHIEMKIEDITRRREDMNFIFE